MAVPVARITDKAREVRVGAFLLAVLVAPFYVLGWLIGRTVQGFVFLGAAVKVGWNDARGARVGSPR